MTTPNPSSPLWPADFQGCRVTAQYLDLGGLPLSGTVSFVASPAAMLDYANKITIMPKVFTATLSATGVLDIVLPATDDPDINPNGWTYAVSENFLNGRKYNIEAPQNQTVDLSQIAPVPAANGTPIVRGPRGAAGGIQSINGSTAPYQTLTYTDVNADQAGAATAAAATAQSNAVTLSLQKAQNLADLPNLTTALSNLGLTPSFAATPNTVIKRNSSGSAQVNTPLNDPDISNKGYVDFSNNNAKFYTDTSFVAARQWRGLNRTTQTSAIPDTTYTTINSWDVGAFNNSTISYGSGIYTINVAGIYVMMFTITWPATTSTHSRLQGFYKNGARPPYDEGLNFWTYYGSQAGATLSCHAIMSFAVNDTVQAYVYHGAGTSLTLSPKAFHIVRIG